MLIDARYALKVKPIDTWMSTAQNNAVFLAPPIREDFEEEDL